MTEKKMTDAEWQEAYRKAGGTYTGGPILPPGEQAPPPSVHEEDIDWGGDGEPSAEWTRKVRAVVRPFKPDSKPSGNGKALVAPDPTLVAMMTVQPEKIDWIWPGRLAAGKLAILAGDPGLGKSWVSLDMAARVTTGADWPDGAAGPVKGDVILLNAEDGLADTIRPRLDSVGADVHRVHALTGVRVGDAERDVRLTDIPSLELAIHRTGARLLVIDPISAYVGSVDSHRDAEVRGLLAPLAGLAERTHVAILAIMHLSKSAQQSAIYRACGSIAFTAAPRIVLAVAADPQNPKRRFLLPIKTSVAAEPATLAYTIVSQPGSDMGELVWDTTPVPADDVTGVLGPAAPARDREEGQEAEALIRDLLATEEWPLDARDALKAGEAQALTHRTMQRTAERLGIRKVRHGFGKGSRIVWHRPDEADPGPIGDIDV